MKRSSIAKRDHPRLAYQADPVRESLKILGRKWTLLILRDIAFLKIRRFGEILRNNPGLTPRVLSRRLRQMTHEGLLRRQVRGENVSYWLTKKGEDAIFILLAILRYGIMHHMGQATEEERRLLTKTDEASIFDISSEGRERCE